MRGERVGYGYYWRTIRRPPARWLAAGISGRSGGDRRPAIARPLRGCVEVFYRIPGPAGRPSASFRFIAAGPRKKIRMAHRLGYTGADEYRGMRPGIKQALSHCGNEQGTATGGAGTCRTTEPPPRPRRLHRAPMTHPLTQPVDLWIKASTGRRRCLEHQPLGKRNAALASSPVRCSFASMLRVASEPNPVTLCNRANASGAL
ncbi:hypothetical protein QFZ38_005463 [Pseudomonas cedrina]|nr:hypothetical protein [Pseudomonas cedrina]